MGSQENAREGKWLRSQSQDKVQEGFYTWRLSPSTACDTKGLILCWKDPGVVDENSDDDSYSLIFPEHLPYGKQYLKLFMADSILTYLNVLNHVSSQPYEVESVIQST